MDAGGRRARGADARATRTPSRRTRTLRAHASRPGAATHEAARWASACCPRCRPSGSRRTFGDDPPILSSELDAGGRPDADRGRRPSAAGPDRGTARRTLPIGYDSTSRDRPPGQSCAASWIPSSRPATPLLLIGDFNVVDREPGYGELAAGLIDAQQAVGLGPGHTWRPGRLEWLPFGLLRIDCLFSANGVDARLASAPTARRAAATTASWHGVHGAALSRRVDTRRAIAPLNRFTPSRGTAPLRYARHVRPIRRLQAAAARPRPHRDRGLDRLARLDRPRRRVRTAPSSSSTGC